MLTKSWYAAFLVSVLALAGCGQSPSDTESGDADADFRPVSIKHALGTATIDKRPERIVTLGQGSTETVIALGLTPVGIEAYPWGSDDSGYLPWINEAITDEGGELPVQIPYSGASGDLDFEAIAELEPDLILAPWSGITQEQYDRVSALAPTVAYEKEAWVITWQQQITVIGKALGMPDEAAGLITEIDERFASSARAEYKDLTFSYIYNTGPGTLGVFFEDEQRVAMVRALGLTVDPVVESLREFEKPGTDSALLSLENADKFKNSDLIFTFYSSPEARAEVEAQPAYKAIPAMGRGSVVAPTDQPFVTASSLINPLTVPWALERYVPLIDEAVAKLN